MTVSTDRCSTWQPWQTGVQHDSIDRQVFNTIASTDRCSTRQPRQTGVQHDSLDRQVFNMTASTDRCSTWQSRQTDVQHDSLDRQVFNTTASTDRCSTRQPRQTGVQYDSLDRQVFNKKLPPSLISISTTEIGKCIKKIDLTENTLCFAVLYVTCLWRHVPTLWCNKYLEIWYMTFWPRTFRDFVIKNSNGLALRLRPGFHLMIFYVVHKIW